MKKNILIVSMENDIHALAVKKEIENRGSANPFLLEADRLVDRCRVTWTEGSNSSGSITFSDGAVLDLREIATIWWRRWRVDQILDRTYEVAHSDLINNDWRGTIRGTLETLHTGTWISNPAATERASNKLHQLNVAKHCGLRVPDTIVSNDPVEIRAFVKKHPAGVIVKPVIGTKKAFLFTQFVDENRLDNSSMLSSPAIYQEYISGEIHLRVNCFGDSVYASSITTSELDWRQNLNVPIQTFALDKQVRDSVLHVLEHFNLSMGVVDLKVAENGEVVWFEVNPQGQFLFLEGLTREPLLQAFVDFLV
ncbi:ATP-grasp domain-containing protein [Burkholderia cenocepacia]|uniref:ATP-grasp domain-containing protein n=1 Tax=Burkholderia cenocepacia TaxID=95486 RepID=UPI0019086355|nr:hypothetical protein [Burkholderia cenocepacia]MBJ9897858.1 hypothetical protein [Burkholderia cenocepacia]MBJ9920130.1 hypothetical protein [Burkholderia cenocepacia]MBR8119346.1 hypothetical protein [Burkholderia cenocepacia]MBR8374053.1 hypothetical protein [Burkholderia cenocepacia]MBR8443026.1 hypothetical protein [Burkholderia cenocepacia]